MARSLQINESVREQARRPLPTIDFLTEPASWGPTQGQGTIVEVGRYYASGSDQPMVFTIGSDNRVYASYNKGQSWAAQGSLKAMDIGVGAKMPFEYGGLWAIEYETAPGGGHRLMQFTNKKIPGSTMAGFTG